MDSVAKYILTSNNEQIFQEIFCATLTKSGFELSFCVKLLH